MFFIDGVDVVSAVANRRSATIAREMDFLVESSSVPLWVIFEEYNELTLSNWHYVGLPETLLDPLRRLRVGVRRPSGRRDAHHALILVGRDPRSPRARRTAGSAPSASRRRAWPGSASARGAVMLLLPIVYPSPWLAARSGCGFIFLLDPLERDATAPSRCAATCARAIPAD